MDVYCSYCLPYDPGHNERHGISCVLLLKACFILKYFPARVILTCLPLPNQRTRVSHSVLPARTYAPLRRGHGALTIAMGTPDRFRSVSAFAPICNPTQCAWGQKAFTGYLGKDEKVWYGRCLSFGLYIWGDENIFVLSAHISVRGVLFRHHINIFVRAGQRVMARE